MALIERDNDILNVVCELSEIKELKVSVRYSTTSGLIVGGATMVGGLLLGPMGVIFAGALSAIVTGVVTMNAYRSVPDIIMNDTTDEQRACLAAAIRNLLVANGIPTIAKFMQIIAGDDRFIVATLIPIIERFVQQELGMKLKK